MKNTITIQFVEKQNHINQRKIEAMGHYPALWTKMVSEWNSPSPDDKVWLVYSANYLLRTGNVQWAVDPLSLNWRIPGAPKVNLSRDLQRLSFVLLTHSHHDHLDYDLISAVKHLSIRWVVPEFMAPSILEKVDLPEERMIIPRHLQPIVIEGLHILPFDGLHLVIGPDGTSTGVPEMSYLVEYSGKRWLFPGDTRIYDANRLPVLGPVDTLFAHLWLGRGAALQEPPLLVNEFCQFCADLKPDRVILTHLEELGRSPEDYWDVSHVKCILSQFDRKYPGIQVTPAYFGESILL